MAEGAELAREEALESAASRYWKVAAIVLAICGTIYGAKHTETGSVVFSVSSMIMLIFALVPPNELAPAFLPRLVFRLNKGLRGAFQKSDRLVRAFMVAISVGGTALVCKYGITEFSLLPPYLDVVIKRIGPFLVISSCVLYPMSVVSNRIHVLSNVDLDRPIRRYEFLLYVAVLLFCLTVFVACVGFQLEAEIKSHASPDSPTFPKTRGTILPGFGLEWLKLLGWIGLIWLIWIIGLTACILSRLWEMTWRRQSSVLRPF